MTDAGAEREQTEIPSEELREQQIVLRTLVSHPGWKLLERHALLQQADYQRTALRPLQSMLEVPAGEFTKGVAQGITEVLSLPQQLLDMLEVELQTRRSRQPQTEGDDDAGTDDDE